MILASKGKLSIAQSVAATAADSTNVIQIYDYVAGAPSPVMDLAGSILAIQNAVAAAAIGTLTIDLVLSLESTLDTNYVLDRVYIAAGTDPRIKTAGAPLHEYKISSGDAALIKAVHDANPTSDLFVGLIITTTTFTLLINASIGSVPQDDGAVKTQETVSPVGVPGVCSAGSGE